MTAELNIYLVRHAESVGNVEMDTGHSDDTTSNGLTEAGMRQARLLGDHLRELQFCRVYSSDYLRAVQTAELILGQNFSKRKNQMPIHVAGKQELREIDLGKFKHSSYLEIARHLIAKNVSYEEWCCPEGETVAQAGKRILKFLVETCQNLFESYDNQSMNVLIISHSAAIASFLHYLSSVDNHPHEIINWDPKKDLKLLKNGCYYRFKVTKGNISCKNLKIEFLEKYVSHHLKQESPLDDERVEKYSKYKDNASLEVFFRKSEAGRKFLHCCQQ